VPEAEFDVQNSTNEEANRYMGACMRAHRRAAGLTLMQLAEKTGIDNGNLSKIERGVRGWPIKVPVSIANALNLSLSDLFRMPRESLPNEPGHSSVEAANAVPEAEFGVENRTTREAIRHMGACMRAYRRAAGLTLEQLGKKTGIDHGNLSKIERGVRDWPLKVSVTIANALNLSLSDLFRMPPEAAAAELNTPGHGLICARAVTVPEAETYVQNSTTKEATRHMGACVRAHRRAAGLTLMQLAEKTGIDNGNLSKIERGVRGWSMKVPVTIANALNLPLSDLFQMPREGAGGGAE